MTLSESQSLTTKSFGPGLKVAVKIAITIFIFAIIASMVDPQAFLKVVSRANPWLLVMVPLFGVPMVVLDSLRWTRVMKGLGRPLSLIVACRYSLVGLFFSNLAPGFLGFDGFRAVQMKRLNVPLDQALQSITFDRLSAFASLLLTILILSPQTIARIVDPIFLGLCILVVCLGIGAFGGVVVIHLCRSWIGQWLPHGLVTRATQQTTLFVRLFSKPKIAVSILASGIAVHVMRASLVFVIAVALSIEMTWLDALAIVPIALLLSMVPISFGDWGVREAVFVVALANIGMTPEEALATSICFGVYRLIMGSLGGLAFLAMKRDHFAVQAHR